VRAAATLAVLGLALAVGAPTAWNLTRTDAAAGAPVEEVLDSSPRGDGGVGAATPTAPGRLPAVATRSADPREQQERPVRFAVPRLGVDAAVEAVGVEPDGQMTIPAEVDRVGWYRFGPAPGSAGSAVVAGHVDSRTQGLGAMAALREAVAGDEVLVADAAGATTRWRVIARELIQKQALPLERLFARQGPPRLTLITCGGPFLPEYGSYRDNVVVVAEPVS
jgi:hypothetical protein